MEERNITHYIPQVQGNHPQKNPKLTQHNKIMPAIHDTAIRTRRLSLALELALLSVGNDNV